VRTLDQPIPRTLVSPSRDYVAICQARPRITHKEMASLSTMTAGVPADLQRLEPRFSSNWRGLRFFRLRNLEGETLVADDPVYPIGFSADSQYLAYAVSMPEGVFLRWRNCVHQDSSGCGLRLNALFAAFGETLASWLGLHRLLARVDGDNADEPFDVWRAESQQTRRGAASRQAGGERRSPGSTYFESQIVIADVLTSQVQRVGHRGIYRHVSGSPDGRYALVHRCNPSVSGPTHGIARWPIYTEVWDLSSPDAQIVYRDSEPSSGVGDSEYGLFGRWHWHPLESATLVKAREQDDGHCIARVTAPFSSEAAVLYSTAGSISRFGWAETGELVVRECEADGSRIVLSVADAHGASPPFRFAQQLPEDLRWPHVSWRVGDQEWNREAKPIWAQNDGLDGILTSSSDGVYIEHFPLNGLTSTLLSAGFGQHETDLYRSTGEGFERIIGALGDDLEWLHLVVETPTTPPGLVLTNRWTGERHAFDLTRRATGLSAGVVRRLISSDTTVGDIHVFLPGQSEGRRPVLLWIEPTFGAGQAYYANRYQPNRYLGLSEMSVLRLVLEGQAVAICPAIQGNPLEEGDAYISRVVERVHAVADQLVGSCIADTTCLVLGGHCFGAYITALVLAHSDRFRAGIAAGGRYNLAAMPLGSLLTAHKRLWETPEVFLMRSPIGMASRIRTPLLLVHGQHDRRVPWQESHELFQAITFAGGECRFVCVPNEEHFFQSVEGTAVFVGEMVEWIHSHVSNTT
jgi:pimeloyl-ACP methyl ester carboxylesterase